jgi:ribosomal protein S18 acetylase RimI-like enzyme
MDQIIIRKANVTDCTQMMALIKELAAYEKAPDAVTVSLSHFEESGFGANPVWWALVAEQTRENSEKSVVGFALYYIRYSTWKGRRLYLEDIVVTEHMRGKGIGKLLFDQLLETGREQKFSGMVWQVLNWNEPALNFYRKYKGLTLDEEWVNGSIEF